MKEKTAVLLFLVYVLPVLAVAKLQFPLSFPFFMFWSFLVTCLAFRE